MICISASVPVVEADGSDIPWPWKSYVIDNAMTAHFHNIITQINRYIHCSNELMDSLLSPPP